MQLEAPRNPVTRTYGDKQAAAIHELRQIGFAQQVIHHGAGAGVRTALCVIYKRVLGSVRRIRERPAGERSATHVVFKRAQPAQLAVLNRVRDGRFNNFESGKLRVRTLRWRSRKCFCARRPHERTK